MEETKINDFTKEITEQLDKAGFDYATAIATKAEVEAGAACGQLSIITE
jgi:adenine C2-methylase RlmN of 23S rRNA A2503 and tRNA A37